MRNLIHGNYYLNSLYHLYKHHKSPIYKDNPLIIYQMGKVGSETMEASLMQYSLPHRMFRTHFIDPKNIIRALGHFHTNPRRYYKRSKLAFTGKNLARALARDRDKGHWAVITMVRDPIAQNISSFFQLADLLVPHFNERVESNDINISELMALFIKHYPPDNLFVRWFDDEFNKALRINIYEEPFPHQRGYKIYERRNLKVLILRLENLNDQASNAFQEFLELSNFALIATNAGKDKSYAELYSKFRTQAVFPKEYVDEVYGSRMAKYFYSEEELSTFRSSLKIAQPDVRLVAG